LNPAAGIVRRPRQEKVASMETIVILGIVVGAVLILALLAVGTYNGLINRKIETENAWSQIDVQLKRRYDLIPNLVETVKGYASHEKDTLEKVVQARNMAMSAKGVAEQAAAENMLSGALKSLFAVTEAYPDLKANQNFLGLQEELTATENRIGFARQHYNDSVSQYNSAIMRFPSNILAGMFGFRPADFFQLDGAEAAAVRKAPQVKF
jgi:LemA protein